MTAATAAQVSPSENSVSAGRGAQWLQSTSIARLCVIAFGLVQAWTTRFEQAPDGTTYIDIAKAYARGDWAHALSTYWSPLYSWFMAAYIALFKGGPVQVLVFSHVLNFWGFLACIFAWDLLFLEWERWQGPPVHGTALRLTGYCTLVWATLHLIGLGMQSADIFTVAIMLWIAALLVRVQSFRARLSDYIVIGLLLGLGFLAKAALLILFPFTIGAIAWTLRSVSDRRLWTCAAISCLTIAPFIAAISIGKHRLVLTDTGKYNYGMLVGGYTIEGYKSSVTPLPAGMPHPFLVRSDNPRVLSFEQHATGTYPVNNDPAWWLEGMPFKINPALQWWSLEAGTLFSLSLLAGCPALILLLAGIGAYGRRDVGAAFRDSRYLLGLSLPLVASYIVIVLHSRYIAGSFALLGFLPVAILWRTRLTRGRLRLLAPAMAIMMFFSMRAELIGAPFFLAGELLSLGDPPGKTNVDLASAARQHGVMPGDQVAYVGSASTATWLQLDEAQIVSVVPDRIFHNNLTVARNYMATFETPDRLWHSDAAAWDRALAAFRGSGAKWVVADNLPPDVKPGDGWIVLGRGNKWSESHSGLVYLRPTRNNR